MKSKKTYRIYSLVILGIVLVVGTSFAWFVWQSPDNTDVAITVSGMKINYNGGNDIIGTNLSPTMDITDDTKSIIKTFAISSTNNNSPYARFMLNLNTLPQELQEESLKWQLYKEDELISQGNFADVVEGSQIVLQVNQLISLSPEVDTYKLYIYIDGSMDNPATMGGQSFNFSLVAEASQGRYNVSIGENLLLLANIPYTNVVVDGTVDKNICYQGGGCSTWTENYGYSFLGNSSSFNTLEQCNEALLSYCAGANFHGGIESCQQALPCTQNETIVSYTGEDCIDINNYVIFNNELWRIIGMFNVDQVSGEVSEGTVTSSNLIKIIRSEPVNTEIEWGNTNNWSESYIYQYLNGSGLGQFLNSKTFTEVLDTTVNKTRWKLGSYDGGHENIVEPASLTPSASETLEVIPLIHNNIIINSNLTKRLTSSIADKNIMYNSVMDISTNNLVNNNPAYVDNYMGLIYPSDYAYATSSVQYNINNWLYLGKSEWTMTPVLDALNSVNSIDVDGSIISSATTLSNIAFRPVTYIPESTIIYNGIGSKDDPFIIQNGNMHLLQ